MTTEPTISWRWLLALCTLLLGLGSCGTYEDKRIRQLLHEKGFGTRADGDATNENFLGGMDLVQFLISPDALAQPGAERLAELTVPQPVAIDGTIFVPFIGPVYALGHTEAELGVLVGSHLRGMFQFDLDLQARIVVSNKFFYSIGEVGVRGRHLLETDMTLWDALMLVQWTNLANLGRVMLIRPDAEHPLVIDINMRDVYTGGATASNIRLRERDTIYVPPTALGMLARILQRLLEPVALAVQTLVGAARVQVSYDVLTGREDAGFFRF